MAKLTLTDHNGNKVVHNLSILELHNALEITLEEWDAFAGLYERFKLPGDGKPKMVYVSIGDLPPTERPNRYWSSFIKDEDIAKISEAYRKAEEKLLFPNGVPIVESNFNFDNHPRRVIYSEKNDASKED